MEKTITIRKGRHSFLHLPKIGIGKYSIHFKIVPSFSWYYDPPENNGANKILGISHGHHHWHNSARFVFICKDDYSLWLGGYCYVDGVSPQQNSSYKEYFLRVFPDIKYSCEIHYDHEHDMWLFVVDNRILWKCPSGKNHKFFGYVLFPYIGGSFTLPHDVHFKFTDY